MPKAYKGPKSSSKSSSACRGLLSMLPDLVGSSTDHALSEREPLTSHDTYRRRRLTISPPRRYNNFNRLKCHNSMTKGHKSIFNRGRDNRILNKHISEASRSSKNTSGADRDKSTSPQRRKAISRSNGHLVKRGELLASDTNVDVRHHRPSATTTGTSFKLR